MALANKGTVCTIQPMKKERLGSVPRCVTAFDGLCRAETAWLSLVIRNSTEKDDKPAKFGAGKWGEKLPEQKNLGIGPQFCHATVEWTDFNVRCAIVLAN